MTGLGGALIGFGGATVIIANDPIDHNYQQEARLVFGKMPAVPSDMNRRLRRAFRDVFNNSVQIVAYTQAAYTSSNRYEGALEAGDVGWADLHFSNADAYLRQAGVYFAQQESALAVLISELNRNGIVIDAAPYGDYQSLREFQWWLREWPNFPTVGPGVDPNPVRDVLYTLGFTAEQVDEITWIVATERVDRFGPVQWFPDLIWNVAAGMTEMGLVFQE